MSVGAGGGGSVPKRFVSPQSGRTNDVLQLDHVVARRWARGDADAPNGNGEGG